MVHNTEWAEKPLTGEASDLQILKEREQRCLVGVNGRTDRMIIPTAHFCELRDMYTKLVHERDADPEPEGEMSIEQAIAILNPETSREVLAAYEYYGSLHGKEAMTTACEEACRIAVKIMREKLSAERQKEKEEFNE